MIKWILTVLSSLLSMLPNSACESTNNPVRMSAASMRTSPPNENLFTENTLIVVLQRCCTFENVSKHF